MSNKIRAKTFDAAFQFRMGAGFPGDVNRTHPATIEPTLIDATTPPTLYGQAVLVDATTQGVRPFVPADVGTPVTAYGVTVRPYPAQASAGGAYGSATLGVATPPVSGPIDVLRAGYIMVKIPVGVVVVKGGSVWVWNVASAAPHVQGGFEGAASAGNAVLLNGVTFNGSADATGNVEIAYNV